MNEDSGDRCPASARAPPSAQPPPSAPASPARRPGRTGSKSMSGTCRRRCRRLAAGSRCGSPSRSDGRCRGRCARSLRRSSAALAASSDDALATRRIVPLSSSRSTMQPSPRNGTVRSASRWRVSSRSSVRSSSALASARNSSSLLRSVSSLCSRALSTDSAARRAIAEAKSRSSWSYRRPDSADTSVTTPERLAACPQRHEHRGAQPEGADDLEVLGVARALLDHLVGDLAVQLGLAGAQHLRHSRGRVRVGRITVLEVPRETLLLGVVVGRRRGARSSRRLLPCGSRTSRARRGTVMRASRLSTTS